MKKTVILIIVLFMFGKQQTEAQFVDAAKIAFKIVGFGFDAAKTAKGGIVIYKKASQAYDLLNQIVCATYNWEIYKQTYGFDVTNCMFDYETKLFDIVSVDVTDLLLDISSSSELVSGIFKKPEEGGGKSLEDKLDIVIEKLEMIKKVVGSIDGRYDNEIKARILKQSYVENSVTGNLIDF